MKLLFQFLLVSSVAVHFLDGAKRTRGQAPPSNSDYSANTDLAEGETEAERDYDDGDVQFETSPPNLLILLADPKNGTTVPLSSTPNSDVVLDRSFGKVHLFCSAYYPVKWTYSGDGFPFLNVDNTRYTDDFYDPTTYAFSALLELEGLKESQTGNYTCHKSDNVSYASSYHVYVPGERILLPENNTKVYIDAAETQVRIPCSVSDPRANVTLLKSFNKGQGQKDWMAISSAFYTFSPNTGYIFKGSSVLTGIGDFICVVGDLQLSKQRVHVSVIVNNTIAGSKAPLREDCCDKKFLRSLGDERTSCRSFISEQCQAAEFLDPNHSPCSDWKLAEFLKSPVELCKQEIAPSNSSVAVGYFVPEERGSLHLYMYCQADPKEYTQGFKLAVEWANGSMIFVEDDRLLVPGLSEYPSGYEVHAEITDLLNKDAPLDPIILHCYIPLKFSFKWIKILKHVPTTDLRPFAEAWYNVSGSQPSTVGVETEIVTDKPSTVLSTAGSSSSQRPRFRNRYETQNTSPPPPALRGRSRSSSPSSIDSESAGAGRFEITGLTLLTSSILILSVLF